MDINRKFIFRKSGKQKIKPNSLATLPSGFDLIELWKKSNFMEFNTWLQTSKALLKIEYLNVSYMKQFFCDIFLTLPLNDLNFSSRGFGRNKKEAKIMAIEEILVDLARNNCLISNLNQKNINKTRNKMNVTTKKIKKEKNSKLSGSDERLSEGDSMKNKKMKERNSEKNKIILEYMMRALKEDCFQEACFAFSRLIKKNSLKWNELSIIWTYAIYKDNINYVHVIFDLIANFARNKTNENTENITPVNKKTDNTHKLSINKKLKEIYGFGRMPSNNVFETYDHFNFFISFDDSEFFVGQNPLVQKKKEKIIEYDFSNYFSIVPITQRDPEYYNLIKPPFLIKNPVVKDVPLHMIEDDIKIKKKEKPILNLTLTFETLNNLYDSLLFLSNPSKSLLITEIINSRVNLLESEFRTHKNACDFFLSRRNMLAVDFISKITKKMQTVSKSEIFGILEPFSSKLSNLTENLLKFFCSTERIKANEIVLLRAEEEEILGLVQKVSENDYVLIKCALNKKKEELLNTRKTWRLNRICSKDKYDGLVEGLTAFVGRNKVSPGLLDLVLNESDDYTKNNIIAEENAFDYGLVAWKPFNNDLNMQQIQAVLNGINRRMSYIEGTKGSGKTKIATEIILQWSEEVSSESKEKQEARKKKIFEAQIVCTTPSSLATQLMSDMIFPRVLIEDVEKLNEMEIILTMSKDCSQIVLVGDSILSPPLTTPLLVSKGIQHSLLERLGIHPIFLETNPNVLRKIMELPHLNWKNQNWRKDRISLFFACSLQNDEIKEERYPNNDYNFVARKHLIKNNRTKPPKNNQISAAIMEDVQLLSSLHYQKYNAQNKDIKIINFCFPNKKINFAMINNEGDELNGINFFEIQIIKKILEEVNGIKIGVSSFYMKQVEKMKEEIKMDIEIALFDELKGNIGLLKDFRNLNSLLTFETKGIICIGNVKTLSSDKMWNQFFLWCKENGFMMKISK